MFLTQLQLLSLLLINKMKRLPTFLTIMLFVSLFSFNDKVLANDYDDIIESALLYRGDVTSAVGTTEGDWTAFAYGRYYNSEMPGYCNALSQDVKERYKSENKLSAAKSTEWHRIILSLLANGKNPFSFTEENINLMADGTYNRGYTISLGRQGINGWIWSLIALDSVNTEIPYNAFYSRDDIIIEIIKQQTSDGGFALSGTVGDIDITANVITALAPYYGNSALYTYELNKTGVSVTKSVKNIIDEALIFLSNSQLATGGYSSFGTENCESSAQIITALCTMGIDIYSDNRFIKNGKTVVDAVLSYRNPDGGFSHISGGVSSIQATDQASIALIAIDRLYSGETPVYDFSNLDFSNGNPNDDDENISDNQNNTSSTLPNENNTNKPLHTITSVIEQYEPIFDNNSDNNENNYYSEINTNQINNNITTTFVSSNIVINSNVTESSMKSDISDKKSISKNNTTTVTYTTSVTESNSGQENKTKSKLPLFIIIPTAVSAVCGAGLIVYQNFMIRKEIK
jgi:hypothetical protein